MHEFKLDIASNNVAIFMQLLASYIGICTCIASNLSYKTITELPICMHVYVPVLAI